MEILSINFIAAAAIVGIVYYATQYLEAWYNREYAEANTAALKTCIYTYLTVLLLTYRGVL